MIDPVERAELCAQLEQMLAHGDLPSSQQAKGERLLERLTSDVSVVLAGPETGAKEYLQAALTEAALPQTSVSSVSWEEVMDFASADVCIWCTATFDAQESTQWQTAPDQLKDHSFLAMFYGPAVAEPQLRLAIHKRLSDVAAEEFYGLFEVPFDRRGPSATPKAVTVLVNEVAQTVRMGLAADTDNAILFIKTHQIRSRSKSRPIPQHAPSVAVAPESTVASPADRQAENAVYETALETLRGHLSGLEPLMQAQDDDAFHQILELCQTTSEAVAGVFSECDLSAVGVTAFKDDAQNAADTILLMSLEGGLAPTVSAVTTVLQLRREMEGLLIS